MAAGGIRSRVCLTCRTLFDAGEECRGKRHKTVAVASPTGRAKLADEVWGPDSRARALRQAAKAGATGGAAGSALDFCNGVSPLDACNVGDAGEAAVGVFLAIAAFIAFAIVGALLFFGVRALVRWARERWRRPVATGALTAAPKPKQAVTTARGVVRSGKLLDTPWREGSAYGYALELHEKRVLGGGAMMRDARSAGFEVALDDGRVMRVPEGRVRVLSPLAKVESEAAKLNNLVDEIDFERRGEPTVFPFEYAKAITIEAGDRVEVVGSLDVSADAPAGGYRDSANVVVPVGVPCLRVTKSTGVRIATGAAAPQLEAPFDADADELEAPESRDQRNA